MSSKNDDELKALISSGQYPSGSTFASLIESKKSLYFDIRPNTSSSQTISDTDVGEIIFNPTAAHDVVLNNSFKKGLSKTVRNNSADFSMVAKANDGSVICKIIPKSWATFYSTQDAPTASTHWKQSAAGGGWVDAKVVASDFSAGFDTPTLIESKIMREGPNALEEILFTTGASMGLSPATMKAPLGLKISIPSILSKSDFGDWKGLFNSGTTMFASINSVGVFYYNGNDDEFGMTPNTDSGNFEPSDAFDILTPLTAYRAKLKYPVAGWEIG